MLDKDGHTLFCSNSISKKHNIRNHERFKMSGAHRETVQKQIHQDWANREYIEVITASIKRITDFLNSFGKPS